MQPVYAGGSIKLRLPSQAYGLVTGTHLRPATISPRTVTGCDEPLPRLLAVSRRNRPRRNPALLETMRYPTG